MYLGMVYMHFERKYCFLGCTNFLSLKRLQVKAKRAKSLDLYTYDSGVDLLFLLTASLFLSLCIKATTLANKKLFLPTDQAKISAVKDISRYRTGLPQQLSRNLERSGTQVGLYLCSWDFISAPGCRCSCQSNSPNPHSDKFLDPMASVDHASEYNLDLAFIKALWSSSSNPVTLFKLKHLSKSLI